MMLLQKTLQRLCVGLSAALLLSGASGCGKLVSGANTIPSVKYLADASAVAETETTTPAADTGTSEPAAEGGIGSIKGRVVFDGAFTALPPLFAKGAATKDPSVCGVEAIPDERIEPI